MLVLVHPFITPALFPMPFPELEAMYRRIIVPIFETSEIHENLITSLPFFDGVAKTTSF